MWHVLLNSQTAHRIIVTKLALWASRAGWARCLAGPAAAPQHKTRSLQPFAQPFRTTPIIPLAVQRYRSVQVVAMGRRKSFYAVRVGRQPGIYRTWEECQPQVNGYPKAQFKGFDSLHEAKEYLGGTYAGAAGGMHTQAVAVAAATAAAAGPFRHAAAGQPAACYAVFKGQKTGIFDTWPEAQAATKGHPNAVFKKHPTREAARSWLQSLGAGPSAGRSRSPKRSRGEHLLA
jgi:hypothetical protein